MGHPSIQIDLPRLIGLDQYFLRFVSKLRRENLIDFCQNQVNSQLNEKKSIIVYWSVSETED